MPFRNIWERFRENFLRDRGETSRALYRHTRRGEGMVSPDVVKKAPKARVRIARAADLSL